jgi:predicted nucleic acid-binding protein
LAGYVLDSSAIMTVLFSEEGDDTVQGVLRTGEQIYVPFIAMMEVQYKILRSRPDRYDDYMAYLESWPAEVVESTPGWCRGAAEIKVPGKVSLADAWMAALALDRDATLVHKDREFESVDDLKTLQLPYETRPA